MVACELPEIWSRLRVLFWKPRVANLVSGFQWTSSRNRTWNHRVQRRLVRPECRILRLLVPVARRKRIPDCCSHDLGLSEGTKKLLLRAHKTRAGTHTHTHTHTHTPSHAHTHRHTFIYLVWQQTICEVYTRSYAYTYTPDATDANFALVQCARRFTAACGLKSLLSFKDVFLYRRATLS